jgi:hypothetical protein
MSNQTRPRKTEANNSIVRDSAKFEEHLKRYAEFHAAQIKSNLIVFGYEPLLHADVNAEMAFINDTTMLPNISYATQPNGIHSFPDSGTEVRPVTPQEYRAVTVFLLWFFRTDENLVEGEKFDKIRLLSPGELVTRQKIEESRNKTITAIEDGLRELKKYTPPADLSATTSTAEASRIQDLFTKNKATLKYPNVLLQTLASNIFNMLVETGLIAALEKAPASATKKAASGPDDIKPLMGNPQILFKTHKCEVKQHIAHLSNDLVAWMIHGHVSVDADAVLTSIDSAVASKATVKEQIKESQDVIKPRTAKSTPLQDTLADFYKYYAVGAAKGLFTTRL